VEEECAALAADPSPEPLPDPDAYAGVKGARDLTPRGLAVLRELHETRERLALATRRPPFKILASETLLLVALALPRDPAALAAISGFTPRAVERWGAEVLAAVERALELPEDALPVLARTPRPQIDGATRRRIEALRAWRTEAAPRFGLDPGVLLPNRLIGEVARAAPREAADLERIEGLRRWRADILGVELLQALRRGPRA
jgi:ribonuclease D